MPDYYNTARWVILWRWSAGRGHEPALQRGENVQHQIAPLPRQDRIGERHHHTIWPRSTSANFTMRRIRICRMGRFSAPSPMASHNGRVPVRTSRSKIGGPIVSYVRHCSAVKTQRRRLAGGSAKQLQQPKKVNDAPSSIIAAATTPSAAASFSATLMSHHSHELAVPAAEDFIRRTRAVWPTILSWWAPSHSRQFPRFAVRRGDTVCSFLLVRLCLFFTIFRGCLFWTCLHHASDSEWSCGARQLENLAGLLPYLRFYFFRSFSLADYLWSGGLSSGDDPMFDAKQPISRTGFSLFATLSISSFSVSSPGPSRVVPSHRITTGAARIALSCASSGWGAFRQSLYADLRRFDWLMSLQYEWYSTMWGVYIFAGARAVPCPLLVLVVTLSRIAVI